MSKLPQQLYRVACGTGLGVSLACLACALGASWFNWFSVPTGLRAPAFGLWSVCWPAEYCTDPTTERQYGYNAALISARLFVLLACILLLWLAVLCAASLLRSPKLHGNALVLPVTAAIVCVLLLVACVLVEAGVRLQVTRYLTVENQPRIDSVTQPAGVLGWAATALSLLLVGVTGALFNLSSESHV